MKPIQQKIDEELKKIKDMPVLPKVEDDQIEWYDNENTMASSYKLDDWIIQPLDLANLTPLLNTVSLSGTGGSSTYSLGASGGLAYNYTNYTFNTAAMGASGHTGGIHIPEGSDITIGERSLLKTLDKIEQRLSILVPDPKKLERYEALKQAYEHYQTLEALCSEEPQQDSK
jgi:hypothetical protein